jgi:hypothetical protein
MSYCSRFVPVTVLATGNLEAESYRNNSGTLEELKVDNQEFCSCRNMYKLLVRRTQRKKSFGDLHADGRIILK